eukprot:CAMPEP_0119033888 /NCGR_PEP_ID=MMETSP1177-20130426/961_1 /TAXON_ID=2985 /ORGANISM="Ochromonas sp, Strain CCMP1899" /LENGTH=641 /DNA_ID=CAMNT_0006990989 /DNA_START=138 /DNA_END=2060 /DNA_ORIENTATION=-
MGTNSSRLRSHKDDTVKSHKDDAGFNDSTNATPPETPLGSPRRRISNFYQIKHIEPNEIDEKIRVQNSSKILIIGNNRIKVATACCIRKMIALNDTKVEIMVATRDPDGAKNYPLIRAGIKLIKADMNSPETLSMAIVKSGADTVFLVSPNEEDRSTQTISGISACKRAGVGHVVVLSSTCVESQRKSIFGDQCKQIETFIKASKMSYTVIRIPILMDNYLSQLQSMVEYGIFYRPLSGDIKRNAITVHDLGAAAALICLHPGSYSDRIIDLNGPLTDCETAAKAFSVAFGKPIIYEQVTYVSYRETLLHASLPPWHADGVLELFKMFERKEEFCNSSTQELETILGRPPSTIHDLALNTLDSKSRTVSTGSTCEEKTSIPVVLPYSELNIIRHNSVEDFSSSLPPTGISGILKITLHITESTAPCKKILKTSSAGDIPQNSPERVHMVPRLSLGSEPPLQTSSTSTDSDIPVKGSELPIRTSYTSTDLDTSRPLRNSYISTDSDTSTFTRPSYTSIDSDTSTFTHLVSASPRLEKKKVVIRDTPLNSPRVPNSPISEQDVITRNLHSRYCILLDGVFTYLPPCIGTGQTRAVGSMENKSTQLNGFVIERLSDLEISLKGSKGEKTCMMIETDTKDECSRW